MFLHVFLYLYLKTVKNLQFLAFLYDLGIARKKEHVIPTSFWPIPLQFQKTSSFPLLQSKSAKNSKNLEKTKKTKKNNIPGLLQK